MRSPSRSGLVAVATAVAWSVALSVTLGCSSEPHSTSDASMDGSGDARQDVSARDGPRDATKDARDSGTREGGSPFLTELSVSVGAPLDGSASLDGSAPVGLVPAFSSDVHDYYVRCSGEANALTVRMTASPDAKSLTEYPFFVAARASLRAVLVFWHPYGAVQRIMLRVFAILQILLYSSSAGILSSRAPKFPTIRKPVRFIPRPSQYFSKSTLPRCMLRPGRRISISG